MIAPHNGESTGKEDGKQNGTWGFIGAMRDILGGPPTL